MQSAHSGPTVNCRNELNKLYRKKCVLEGNNNRKNATVYFYVLSVLQYNWIVIYGWSNRVGVRR